MIAGGDVRVMARHSQSFSLAARLLPAATATDIAAVYGWARACDDAIDLAPAPFQAVVFAPLRAELNAVYSRATNLSDHAAAFARVVRAHGIPRLYPDELLAGLRMDAEQTVYDTTAKLLHYCFRIAGTVGLMCCHVLGITDRRALLHAAHLGMAMQLTNIARDVVEDWGRGRLYLPADLLGAEAGALRAALESGEALPRGAGAALAGTVHTLLALADRYYASADRGLPYLDWRCRIAVRAARLIYAAIGSELGARGCDVFTGRAVVPRHVKLRLVGRALARAAAESPADLRARAFVDRPTDCLTMADAVRPFVLAGRIVESM